MVKVTVVKKMDNGDVEYKVLNDMDTDKNGGTGTCFTNNRSQQ